MWVLLDFICRVDYHAPADFPVKLVFFADGELYEIAYIAAGQEALVCHALRGNKGGSRRIMLVDTPAQIAKIDCPGISGFCTALAITKKPFFHFFLFFRLPSGVIQRYMESRLLNSAIIC